jgi:ribosomal protein S18 acetylase RimI-like enzyme
MTLVGSLPSEDRATSGDSRSLLVESVEAGHVEELRMLFSDNCVPAVTAAFDPFELTAEAARRIALEPRRDEYFVARGPDGLVAMSMLRGFDEGFEVPSFGVFVDHRHHGEGIGRRLTTWTVEEARRRGHPAVRLSVYASNVGALGLYRSLGFEERERNPVARAGGKDEKILMTKPLGG